MNPARSKDGDTKVRDDRTRVIIFNRRTRRRLMRLIKDAIIPGLTTVGFMMFPALAVLAASGVRNGHDFWIALRSGDPGTATALAIFLLAGTAGTYVIRQRQTAMKQESTLKNQESALNEVRETHRKDGEEIRRLLGALTGQDETIKHLVHGVEEKSARIAALEHKVNTLLEKISSGGLEEDDVKELWRTAAGTAMATFQGMFNREVVEIVRSNGHVEFQGTEWAIDNLLRRIMVGTALTDWRIVLYIPRVERRPFADLAMLPARKLLFLLDHLVEVARRQGKEVTLSHIRIAIAREVEPKDEHRSIFLLTRETNDGPEELVITYHRPPTNRTADYNGGKVTVHRGVADQRHYQDVVNGYFYNGFRMTLDELRQAVTSGVFPEFTQEIVHGPGHLRI
jgi:hypothetical protein